MGGSRAGMHYVAHVSFPVGGSRRPGEKKSHMCRFMRVGRGGRVGCGHAVIAPLALSEQNASVCFGRAGRLPAQQSYGIAGAMLPQHFALLACVF